MENLNEHYSEVWKKAEAYDKLDQKFRLICNEGVQGVLQNVTQCGLAHKKITEQQALNKIAERFPMTGDQIISTLEKSLLGVSVVVTIPRYVADYLEMRKEKYPVGGLGAAITSALAKWEKPEIVNWMNHNVELFADAWLNGYTVAQEPEWLVKGDRGYLTSISISRGASIGWSGNTDKDVALKFTDKKKAKAAAYLSDGKVELASVGIEE